jgi:hypothetical protein
MTTAHTDLDPFRSPLLTAKVRVPAFVLSLAKAPELDIRCIQSHHECSYYLEYVNKTDLCVS